ncbi:MAG: Gfo/Idh/MocA family oxidoreductase [Leptospiraceae bacterium]|nr:Gfo/Idh/MocA family oxidoreductase [Leptospiraceae bacterium]MCP5501479.1 Gfo/Idh/MocA family oxidoreductase [Leptospiraceae bacterium]
MIKVAILGLGRIASILEKDKLRYHPCTHAGTLFSQFGREKFEVLGIYDPSTSKQEQFLEDWNLKESQVKTTLGKIKKEKPELCVIASSSEAHFENAEWAIRNGIQNLLIEKPVCVSRKEIKKLKALQEKFKVRIWVNHERRYHPVYIYAKRLLEKGELGEVITIRASVLTGRQNPGQAYRKTKKNREYGPLLHDGTHAIDFIQWLLGKPKKVFSHIYLPHGENVFPEDQALAILQYPDNVHVFLEAGGYRSYFQFELDIQTRKGRIILSNDGHKIFRSAPSTLYTGMSSLKEEALPSIEEGYQNPWINLYREIYEVCKGKSKEISGPLSDNIEIFKIIESIYKRKNFNT